MSQRITRSFLDAKVRIINSMMSTPHEPYEKRKDKCVANIGNYHVSGANGGFCLHQIVTEGGGVRDVFDCGHQSARDLSSRMSAYIKGICDSNYR
jgi:hypothetical protein